MPWKVTPSLYNSWLFYRYPLFDRTEEQEQTAREEMLNALRRIKTCAGSKHPTRRNRPVATCLKRMWKTLRRCEPVLAWKNWIQTNLRVRALSPRIVRTVYSRNVADVNCRPGIISTGWRTVFYLQRLWTSNASVQVNMNRVNTRKAFSTWRICLSGNQNGCHAA